MQVKQRNISRNRFNKLVRLAMKSCMEKLLYNQIQHCLEGNLIGYQYRYVIIQLDDNNVPVSLAVETMGDNVRVYVPEE